MKNIIPFEPRPAQAPLHTAASALGSATISAFDMNLFLDHFLTIDSYPDVDDATYADIEPAALPAAELSIQLGLTRVVATLGVA